MDLEKVKDLIIHAVEHLSESELREENGWTEDDIKTLHYIIHNDFDIHFKDNKAENIKKTTISPR